MVMVYVAVICWSSLRNQGCMWSGVESEDWSEAFEDDVVSLDLLWIRKQRAEKSSA